METEKIHFSKQWFIDSKKGNIKDHYHFVERLGAGGFGVVYLAEERKSGKSKILINILANFYPRLFKITLIEELIIFHYN